MRTFRSTSSDSISEAFGKPSVLPITAMVNASLVDATDKESIQRNDTCPLQAMSFKPPVNPHCIRGQAQRRKLSHGHTANALPNCRPVSHRQKRHTGKHEPQTLETQPQTPHDANAGMLFNRCFVEGSFAEYPANEAIGHGAPLAYHPWPDASYLRALQCS